MVPLKYASNFWRSLDLSFLNCEIEFDLSWSKDFVTSQISKTDPVTANAPDSTKTALSTTRISLQITDTKIYVRGVTFLAHLKQGLKGAISSNKYRSEITTQPKKNNLDFMNDPRFRNIDELFALSFKSGKMFQHEIILKSVTSH